MIQDRSAAKVARRRRLVRTRLVSLGITVAVLLLIYLWRRDDMQDAVFVVLFAIVLGISLTMARRQRRSVCRWRNDKLAALGSGIAIRIGPPGIQVAGLSASWPEVAAIDTVKRGLGRGPRLRLTTGDGRRG